MRLVRALTYFCLGMSLGCIMVLSMSMTPAEINRAVGSQVVKVLNKEGGVGTGFAIKARSGKPVIVSNRHVCDMSKTKEIFFEKQSGQDYHTLILERSNKTDLCVMDALDKFKGLRLSPQPNVHKPIQVLGHPFGWPLKHTFGYIFNRDVIDVPYGKTIKYIDSYFSTALVGPGNSGSPVVNEDGDVLAVVYALEGATSFMIPYEYLKDILSRY
jgi:S1-C subfamily serine protease